MLIRKKSILPRITNLFELNRNVIVKIILSCCRDLIVINLFIHNDGQLIVSLSNQYVKRQEKYNYLNIHCQLINELSIINKLEERI